MATTSQISAPPRSASPIAYWHLLSLDAPTVAALWTWFVARVDHVHLPAALILAMALAVWILYAVDRLLDARVLDRDASNLLELEERHIFHHQHKRSFIAGVVVAAFALMALLPSLNPAALHLYLLEAVLLIGWFLLVHSTQARLPKEFVVGIYFPAAIFTPVLARGPSLALLPSAVLFAAVCTLNCLFIHAWERESRRFTSLPLWDLLLAAFACTIAFLQRQPTAAVCAFAALLLYVLHRNRFRLSRTHLRAAADLALLTPVLFLPFLR